MERNDEGRVLHSCGGIGRAWLWRNRLVLHWGLILDRRLGLKHGHVTVWVGALVLLLSRLLVLVLLWYSTPVKRLGDAGLCVEGGGRVGVGGDGDGALCGEHHAVLVHCCPRVHAH